MRLRTCAPIGFILSFALVTSSSAIAWGAPTKAQQHFDSGRAHVSRGRCDLAVKDFRASIAAEENVGAWLNLGECLETLNDLPEAYEAYRSAQALAATRRDDRLPVARAGAERVESKTVRVSVRAPSNAGIKVEIDKVPIAPQRWPHILVMPNVQHKLVARGPDGEFEREISGRAGEVFPEVVVVFSNKQTAEPTTTPPAATTTTPTLSPVELAPKKVESGWSTQRTVGVVIGGVGLATLVTGGVFALLTRAASQDVVTALDANGCRQRVCDSKVQAVIEPLQNRAETFSLVTNVLLISGGVLLVGGIVVALVAKPSSPANALMRGPIVQF